MTVLDKIKAFLKYWVYWSKPEKKMAEPPGTKVEAPEKRRMKVTQSRKTGLVGRNQGAGVFLLITTSLIRARTPPVSGALWESGLAAGPARE